MSFDDPFNLSTSFSSFQREDFNTASSASSDDFVEFERFTSFEGDSDEESQSPFSQSSFGAASNNEVAIHSQQPLNHLMFISMLEHICVLYTQDENASDALFKNVCEKLKSGMLIPDLAYLDDFKAVRMKYQSALKSLMEGSVQTLQPKFELLKTKEHLAFNSSAVSGFHTQSLYNEMFSMEEHIASGGFGKVVKAQNKLDYKFYAIKKIPLVDTDVKKILQTLREVQIFSNLEHTNIVRYHSSWLEHGVETFLQKDVHSNQEKNVRRTNIEKSATTEAEEKEFIPVIFQQPIQSHGVFGVGISHLVHPPSHPPKILGLPAGSNDEVNKEPSDNHIVKKRPTLRFNNNAKLLKMTLFIQMELCSRTLRDWLHQRNNEYNEEIGIDVVEVRDMARQISSAVQYIHRQGMLHRDMKPENVFLTYKAKQLTIKVGDFGLARYRPSPSNEPLSPVVDGNAPLFNFGNTEHTIGVGTATYAAPEQLKEPFYTNKVDIWSLGIILYEMYKPFCTEMERGRSIQNLLYKRELADELSTKWPEECELILKMTSLQPRDRPEASHLLKFFTQNPEKKSVSELEKTIKLQREIIEGLRRQLKEQLCLKCHEPLL